MQASEKYEICTEALREFAKSVGFTDVVLGLSGGIDSSVAALMCVDAFGSQHVHGVLMPGPYSSDHSVSDAQELASTLGIKTCTLPITEPYRAFEQVLGGACGGKLVGLAAENTQARCRMVCLMALSNEHGWMLVNTGNKSESMMGYSTLYGDTAGAFAPMGGLYKADVYALGAWRNSQYESEGRVPPVPKRVFLKPPSGELSPDQEDEKSLGIAYEELDPLLISYVEQEKSISDLVAQGENEATVRRIVSTLESYAFKRAVEPPYPQARFYD